MDIPASAIPAFHAQAVGSRRKSLMTRCQGSDMQLSGTNDARSPLQNVHQPRAARKNHVGAVRNPPFFDRNTGWQTSLSFFIL